MRSFLIFTLLINMFSMSYASVIVSNKKPQTELVIDDKTPSLLSELQQKSNALNVAKYSFGDTMTWVALQLVNQPYVGYLLDLKTPEYLYISLTKTDCMLFIEEVLVVSNLIQANKLTMPNLTQGIKSVRYHGSGDIAYCKRNHYFKDWALTNIKNKLIFDVAYPLTGIEFPYKSEIISKKIKSDANSVHRNDLQCILDRENYINLSSQKLGFIPLNLLPKYLDKIQNGDIVGIVRYPTSGDAIQHLGVAYIGKDKQVGIIHASSANSNRKVVIAHSLISYLKQFKNSQGIILLRGR